MKFARLIVLIFLGGLLVGFGLNSCRKGPEGTTAQTTSQYHCPMHPSYISDKPGDCPICGMKLVPLSAEEKPAAAKEHKLLFYRNPMNPSVTSPVPMKDEMGMDYVAVYEDEAETTSTGPAVSGRAAIYLSPDREQLIGVRTAAAEKKPFQKVIRASAKVAFDPDLYNALVEYREGLQALNSAKQSSFTDVKARAEGILEAARLRLKILGLTEKQARQLLARNPEDTGLLLPVNGGRAWIYAQVYEFESPFVKTGQKVEVVSPAFPGHTFQGMVFSVDSVLNPETRSLRVRAEVDNKENLLKPEMYADAVIHADLGMRLVVPKEAVMNTGTRRLAFVRTQPGQYEPREVKVGAEGEDVIEITDGLKEGEVVVSSANFLIDSESKLKSALQNAGTKQ